MTREPAAMILVGVAALVLLVAVGLGATGMRTETHTDSTTPPPSPPADGSAGVVVSRVTVPHSFLGFRFGVAERALVVGFIVPPQCADPATWADLPDGCPAVLGAGTSAGEGRTQDGRDYVAVRFPVSRTCFDSMEPGSAWPLASLSCPAEQGRD